jgi:hypothetical protein
VIHRLNRNLTGEDAIQAGEYASIPDEHIAGTMITVVVACPQCGAKKRLDHQHVVDRTTGNVTPAVRCGTCTFFDWLQLEGWAGVPK